MLVTMRMPVDFSNVREAEQYPVCMFQSLTELKFQDSVKYE